MENYSFVSLAEVWSSGSAIRCINKVTLYVEPS